MTNKASSLTRRHTKLERSCNKSWGTFQDYDSGIIVNDVSLIKVDEPFVFNDNIQPIALPEQGYDPAG
jgi:hypothetical protein